MNKKDQLFIEACKNGNIIEAEKLLKKTLFSKPADIHSVTSYGKTALMIAVENKQPEMVDFLIAKGVDVNDGFYPGGRSAIRLAIDYEKCNDKNTLAIVSSLISAGANPNVQTDKKESLLNAVLGEDPKNDTNKVYEVIAKLLLQGEANINTPSLKWGMLPLHQASSNGYVEITKILIEKGANVNATTSNGYSPLMLACYAGHEQIVDLLIKNGANINQKDAVEKTPLIAAAQNGYKSIVSILIAEGANINEKDKYLNTALTYSPNYEIADLLIKNGAQINERNHRGETPLIFATINKRKDVVALLIANGANVTCKDDEYKQAIDYATEDIRVLFQNFDN